MTQFQQYLTLRDTKFLMLKIDKTLQMSDVYFSIFDNINEQTWRFWTSLFKQVMNSWE